MLVKLLLEGCSVRLLKDRFGSGYVIGVRYGEGSGEGNGRGEGFGGGFGLGFGVRYGDGDGSGDGGWKKNGIIHCGRGHGNANGNGVMGRRVNYDQAAEPPTYIVDEE
jgi:hypothetical protein